MQAGHVYQLNLGISWSIIPIISSGVWAKLQMRIPEMSWHILDMISGKCLANLVRGHSPEEHGCMYVIAFIASETACWEGLEQWGNSIHSREAWLHITLVWGFRENIYVRLREANYLCSTLVSLSHTIPFNPVKLTVLRDIFYLTYCAR